jgi:hypothetical protein
MRRPSFSTLHPAFSGYRFPKRCPDTEDILRPLPAARKRKIDFPGARM